MNVLELSSVSYSYPGAQWPSLDAVTLSVAPGELVVLAGLSGSGKSTLLRVANGLAPHFHGGTFAGQALVAGMDTRDTRPAELAAAVGTLFQDPETQVVMGTVRAELAFGLENRGWSDAAVARGVEEAALSLGIAQLLARPTAELSGGELQRVALGAALAGRPSLLLLDEPTSQLDPVAGDELIGSLRRLNEDTDVAILLAEHRLERCLGFADRAVALVEGRVAFDGSPDAFLDWALAAAPALATPGARLLRGAGLPPAAGVRAARAALRESGFRSPPNVRDAERPLVGGKLRHERPALELDRVWYEVRNGPTILRSLSLSVGRTERVALMGRNGAGKSTLLKAAAGLIRPTRGTIRAIGRVALLLQNPTDYLIHDRVGDEASAEALTRVNLDPAAYADRHPRELSVGEKQRLALAIVLDDPEHAIGVVCLDEPTRGMDRAHKDGLAVLLGGVDAAVLVATHDAEFVASWADRVVLLADGAPIADGPPAEILAGGTYFATETARILDGGALTPEQGIELIAATRDQVPA